MIGIGDSSDSGIGTVTDTGTGTAPPTWSSGRTLRIDIPEITSEPATVTISQRNMTGATGLIFFHAGSNLPDWWDVGTDTPMSNMMTFLEAQGYRLIQVKGVTDYWMNAPLNARLGSAVVAKRGAALIKYVHDTYSGGLPFTYVGSSAGSSIGGYALHHHGLDSIIDVAVLGAAVPHANVYKACDRLVGEEQYWAVAPSGVDTAHGYTGGGSDPCAIGDESVEGPLWSRSGIVSRGDSYYTTAGTRVAVISGMLDTGYLAQAKLYHSRLDTAAKAHAWTILANVPHVIKDTSIGKQAVIAAILNRPYVVEMKEATVTGTSISVTLDEAPKAGDRIVACRNWRQGVANGNTPSGWTRDKATATTPGRVAAIEWKTATGSEGTTLTFTTGTSVVQKVAVYIVRGAGGTVDAGQTVTVANRTSISFTYNVTTAGSISFACVTCEGSGSNVMNKAWTNDFFQMNDGLQNFSAGYAYNTQSGSGKTTVESWNENVGSVGVLSTFGPS